MIWGCRALAKEKNVEDVAYNKCLNLVYLTNSLIIL